VIKKHSSIYSTFLFALVKKDFKVRYSQSTLGMIWLILEPLIMVVTYSVVFTAIGREGGYGAPFPVFFYSGLLLWQLFSASLTRGVRTFISEKNLWLKISFPRYLLLMKNGLVFTADFLLASIPVIPLFLFFGYSFHISFFLLIPIFLMTLMFSVSVMTVIASINVYVRDIGIVIKTINTVLFWFSGVIFDFPFEGPTKFIFYVNPLAGAIRGFRLIMLTNELPEIESLYSLGIWTISMGLIAMMTYKKLNRGFADAI
jgi:lipopolysaccharide transport system permease protein